jgi:hypothetical protein
LHVAGIDPTVRGERLDLDDYCSIARAAATEGKDIA